MAGDDFAAEAEELLDGLSRDLQELEAEGQSVRPELINQIFREMHTLKGLAGMSGATAVAELAHALEDMLDRLRMGRLSAKPEVVNVLFDSIDVFGRLIKAPKRAAPEGAKMRKRVEEIVAAPEASTAVNVLDAIDLDEQARGSLTEYEEHRLIENVRGGTNIYAVEARFEFADFDQKLRALSKRLGDAGEVISTLPVPDPAGTGIAFRLLYGSDLDTAGVGRNAPEARVSSLRKTAPDSLRSASATVRVDIAKIDHVMNIVGELLIARTELEELARQMTTSDLAKLTRTFSRKLAELQSSVIDTRLVPVGQIYSRLGRTVRQIARELHKEVQLVLRGEETELDKMIVEELSDPLLHLIRNALDHGIETPAERVRAGKPREGKLTIAAFQRGTSVAIEISDDGRGVDPSLVRTTAIARGLIERSEVIDAARAHELLFTPGFSTAAAVSDVSGRGVGLDVVKKNIADLKGSIEVFSAVGEGTTFRITLPITLAIIQALIVRASGERFAIPVSAIDKTLRLRAADARDDALPLVRFADVFNLSAPVDPPDGKWFVVVIRSGDRTLGLIVDELLRQQDIVMKSMGKRLKGTSGVAGVAEIGVGELIIVVDAASLIASATAEVQRG